ncbi:MAG TPA: IclR family transcriptional regulator [Phototrophicaceae bacterium]|nr:IclR family transcriptional regulator [Phototrophicaceae bacterium]
MSQSVQRAITLIQRSAQGPLSLAEAANLLDVHKSTALRLLQTLEAARFVRRTGAGTYVFGAGLIELSELTLGSMDLRQLAGRLLRDLQRRTGHTVHLAQLTGDEIIYIDKVDSAAHPTVQLPSRVGHAVSMHASAVGKVILAHLPRPDRERLLSYVTLERHTATTITDRDSFEVELATVRHRGWAADNGERDSYVVCVGVPVRDSRGQVVAAISISSVEVVASLAQLEENLPLLFATARAVSAELGHNR